MHDPKALWKEYYASHRETIQAYQKRYREVNRDRLREYERKRREENSELFRVRGRASYWKHRDKRRAASRKYNAQNNVRTKAYQRRLRLGVIDRLGGECRRCGFDDPRALQLNHKKGGGTKEMNHHGIAGFYTKILSGERDDIELLCANCNWIYEYEIGHLKW